MSPRGVGKRMKTVQFYYHSACMPVLVMSSLLDNVDIISSLFLCELVAVAFRHIFSCPYSNLRF